MPEIVWALPSWGLYSTLSHIYKDKIHFSSVENGRQLDYRFSSVRKTAYWGKHWKGLSKYYMKVTSYEEKTGHLS